MTGRAGDSAVAGSPHACAAMPSPAANAQDLVIRQTTNTLVLEGLPACLRAKGTLTPADLAGIKGHALDSTRRVRDRVELGAQLADARLERDVRAFFAILDDIETYDEARGEAGRG